MNLSTSRYGAHDLVAESGLAAVGITVSLPRWRLPYGRMVVKLLQAAARDGGATVIATSHDSDVISAAETKLTLGSHEERQRVGRKTTRDPANPSAEEA